MRNYIIPIMVLFRGQQRIIVPQLHVLMTTVYMCLATQQIFV